MMITLAAITKVSQWPRLFSEQTVSLQTVGMIAKVRKRKLTLLSSFLFNGELGFAWNCLCKKVTAYVLVCLHITLALYHSCNYFLFLRVKKNAII